MFTAPGLFLLPLFLYTLGPLLVLGLIGWGIWRGATAAREGTFNVGGLLSGYFQLVQGAALVLLLVGGATLLAAGFSYAFGQDFSYRTTVFAPITPGPAQAKPTASVTAAAAPGPTPIPTVAPELQQRRQRDVAQQQRGGMSQGISITIVAALLAGLHGAGRRWLLPRLGMSPAPSKLYLGVMLVVFGITGVIALSIAAANLAGFYSAPAADPLAQPNELPTPPGGAVATALADLPLWIWFLWTTVRTSREIPVAGAAVSGQS